MAARTLPNDRASRQKTKVTRRGQHAVSIVWHVRIAVSSRSLSEAPAHEAAAAAQELVQAGAKAESFCFDVTNLKNVEESMNKILDKYKRIDILVNNAGITKDNLLLRMKEGDWDSVLTVNLKGVFNCTKAISKVMLKQQSGKIINIADTSGYRPFPSFIPYALTKSGMISMTKGLAKALAPHVQVNGVNPGPVLIPEHYTEEEKRIAVDKTLLKREGRAEDVAAAVRFLLEDGDYITGTVLAVDGGRSLN